jgi:hypothetical protein
MPLTEKVTIRREVTYSKDRKHKFMLFIEWDSKLPKAMVIMINPSEVSNKISNDLTTQLVVNNLSALKYGGVYICNMVSSVGSKTMRVTKDNAPYHKENLDIITKTGLQEGVTSIVLAWGSVGYNNRLARNIQDEIIKRLNDKSEVMYVIADSDGKKGLHPLTPSVRGKWVLVPYKTDNGNNSVELVYGDSKEDKKDDN